MQGAAKDLKEPSLSFFCIVAKACFRKPEIRRSIDLSHSSLFGIARDTVEGSVISARGCVSDKCRFRNVANDCDLISIEFFRATAYRLRLQ